MSETEDALAELIRLQEKKLVELAQARDTFMRLNGETACENTRLRGIIMEFCEAELVCGYSQYEWEMRWMKNPHVTALFAEAAKK